MPFSSTFSFSNIALRIIFISVVFTGLYTLKAQDSIELTGQAEFSQFLSEQALPFWFYSNSGGFKNAETNTAIHLNAKIDYDISNGHSIQFGAGLFYRDGSNEEIQRNDLYLNYVNPIVTATLGSKEVLDEFQGLGVVRNNFLVSGNSRALPGIKISLTRPLEIVQSKLYVDAAMAHYSLNDDRFVDGARVHNKNLDVIWNFRPGNTLTLGMEHFAQWGGNSPESGPQAATFSDFIDVFLARRASTEATNSDQVNALGNSLGYYSLEYKYTGVSGVYKFYHEHPFEDGSGTGLKNFPDGIWGFYYSLRKDEYSSILKGFLLEYVSTVSQSGRTGRSGRDNYFNNGIYRSGWTYEGNTIGLPFIDVPDNNRIEAFNLGITIESGKYAALFKGTYVKSLGTYASSINPSRKQVYLFSKHTYELSNSSSVRLDLGYDFNNSFKDNFGGGISYIYTLK